MNEIIPPSDPNQEPAKPVPEPIHNPSAPLSKKVCAAIGVGLFFGSGLLAFAFPPLALLGLVAAIVTLFFAEYRFVFVGYILTVGVLLLGTIIYCSTHPFRME